MATGSARKGTRTKGSPQHNSRGEVRELNQMFPTGKSPIKLERSSWADMDIANLRNTLQNTELQSGEEVPRIDTNGMTWMLPFNRQKMARDLEIAHGGRYNWRFNPDDRKEYSSLIQRSMEDPEAKAELASYRTFEISTDVMATPFALGSFQAINLSADEMPLIVTPPVRQYYNVYWIGQDGGARHAQWRGSASMQTLEMRLVSTDRVEYPLMDLQIGDVNPIDNVNASLRFAMEQKVEDLALEMLIAGKTVSGLRAQLQVHPNVIQANIPDTNYLDLTDTSVYGTANVFTILRLKAVLRHMAMWGYAQVDPAGPISIQNMIMSPENSTDAWDYVDLVSGWDTSGETWGGRPVDNPRETVPQALREQIFSGGGMVQQAWGFRWNTQFNVRVAKGRMYVLTNQPIGWMFTKSEWDRVIEWKDTPDAIEQNIGQILYRRALNFYQPELWKYRYLIVDF